MNSTLNILKVSLAAALLSLAACAATENSRSTGEVIDDAAIAGKIKTSLVADSTTDAVDIDVEVDKGKVQLNRVVDEADERTRAAEIARQTEGVVSVVNNLQINSEERMAGEYIDDKVLTVRVKAALADNPSVHALDIDVEVNRGVVSLGGTVDTAEQRAAAETTAKRVAGVKNVINNLDVG